MMSQQGLDNRSYSGIIMAIYFLILFVVPYALILLPGVPQWLCRSIAVSVFLVLLTGGTFWYGLSSKTRMILPGGKLSEPQFSDLRPKMEKRIRIMVVVFGVFLALVLGLPFTMDIIQLAKNGEPMRITATALDKSVPLFGMWFLEQSVRFSRGGKNYHLFYSLQPLRVGEEYEFIVLPRSRLILDFRNLGDS
jgi:hypothetical protein